MEPLRQRFLVYLDRCFAQRSPRRRAATACMLVGLVLVAMALELLLGGQGWRLAVGAGLLPLGALLCVRGGWSLLSLQRESLRLASKRRIAASGLPVSAYRVGDWEGGGEGGLRCRVLFTFNADASCDPDYLRYLAERHKKLRPSPRTRRLRLPDSFTDGYAIYIAEITLLPGYLPLAAMDGDGPLPCLAEPGESGGIEPIPYFLIFPLYTEAPAEPGQRV